MKFTIDIEKKDVEPLNLFFHSWEHDGIEFDADPVVVQKLAIAVRNAIRSVLFVKVVKSIDELKTELKKESGTKINIEITLNDAMYIVGAFYPDSQNKVILAEKGEAAIERMAKKINKILEGLNNEAEGRRE